MIVRLGQGTWRGEQNMEREEGAKRETLPGEGGYVGAVVVSWPVSRIRHGGHGLSRRVQLLHG